MKLKDLNEGGSILDFLKGFFGKDLKGTKTIDDLARLLAEPMPGHEEMSKTEFLNDRLRKKGIKF